MRQNIFLSLLVTFLLGSAPAMATPLNLDLADAPDIVSSFITVDYNAGTDALTASGFAQQLDDGVSLWAIAGGTFDLSATVDDAGAIFLGAFSIGGTIAALGYNSGTLLTGDLTVVGGNPVGGLLEFLFTVTGGDAAGLFGSDGGIIMGFAGFTDWTSDFGSNPFAASADTAALPVSEPGIVLLTGLGLTLLIAARRRKT